MFVRPGSREVRALQGHKLEWLGSGLPVVVVVSCIDNVQKTIVYPPPWCAIVLCVRWVLHERGRGIEVWV